MRVRGRRFGDDAESAEREHAVAEEHVVEVLEDRPFIALVL